jgi:adenosylcobinamide-phosphate synthase
MTLPIGWPSALGLALGFLADARWGDPRRFHPVAGFGAVAGWLEDRAYADDRMTGMHYVAVLVGATAGGGALLSRACAPHPISRIVVTAGLTWAVLGGRSLRREASLVAGQLEADDLPAARQQVRNLVGRETAELSPGEVARATVESVAENTSDAVVAPLLWGAVGGLPGLVGYRAINTLDAMVGHRSPRYLRFGWAAARLDDLVNWVPARVSGIAAVVWAPLVDGSPRQALRAVADGAGRHPSPNAGVVEAAFAGALGIRLGGRNVYHGQAEDRGELGTGRQVEIADIARANRLAAAVSLTGLLVAVLIRLVRR